MIYKNHKKICLFTNYRTGSSFLTGELYTRNALPGIGEYFDHSCQVPTKPFVTYVNFDTKLRNFKSMPKGVLKLMANHVDSDHKIEEILNECDLVIYNYRRDFRRQALSYIAAKQNQTWQITGLPEWDQVPAEVHLKPIDEEFVDYCVKVLKFNYEKMAQFYKKYPGDLYCMEDFEIQQPYNTKYIWDGEPPVIDQFTYTDSYFTGK